MQRNCIEGQEDLLQSIAVLVHPALIVILDILRNLLDTLLPVAIEQLLDGLLVGNRIEPKLLEHRSHIAGQELVDRPLLIRIRIIQDESQHAGAVLDLVLGPILIGNHMDQMNHSHADRLVFSARIPQSLDRLLDDLLGGHVAIDHSVDRVLVGKEVHVVVVDHGLTVLVNHISQGRGFPQSKRRQVLVLEHLRVRVYRALIYDDYHFVYLLYLIHIGSYNEVQS